MAKGKKTGLTKETFMATKQTTTGLTAVAKYLLEEKNYNFVLLGHLQSDPIEKRFSWYRQLSGGNYYISVRQILEAEKSIRLKSLVSFSGFTMEEVKDVFQDAGRLEEEQLRNMSNTLLMLMEKDTITLAEGDAAAQNVLFYIAGYAARGLVKKAKCQSCSKLLMQEKEVPKIRFEDEEVT